MEYNIWLPGIAFYYKEAEKSNKRNPYHGMKLLVFQHDKTLERKL
jgi:hypothetical protein